MNKEKLNKIKAHIQKLNDKNAEENHLTGMSYQMLKNEFEAVLSSYFYQTTTKHVIFHEVKEEGLKHNLTLQKLKLRSHYFTFFWSETKANILIDFYYGNHPFATEI